MISGASSHAKTAVFHYKVMVSDVFNFVERPLQKTSIWHGELNHLCAMKDYFVDPFYSILQTVIPSREQRQLPTKKIHIIAQRFIPNEHQNLHLRRHTLNGKSCDDIPCNPIKTGRYPSKKAIDSTIWYTSPFLKRSSLGGDTIRISITP